MWRIYKITCKIYHDKAECYKSYVGMTINTVEERFAGHCISTNTARFGMAIRKYGKNNWTLKILEDNIKTETEALEKETFYIEKYNTLVADGKGYNVVRHSQGRLIVNGKLICYSCNQWQLIETFSKDINAKCGRGAWCKDCRKEYNSQNLGHIVARNKKYREDNPEWLTQVRLDYKSTKQEKDKINSKKISDANVLLSIDELRQRTPNKYCHTCKITKETIEFNRRNSNSDGLYSWCKECVRKKNKQSNEKNKGCIINDTTLDFG